MPDPPSVTQPQRRVAFVAWQCRCGAAVAGLLSRLDREAWRRQHRPHQRPHDGKALTTLDTNQGKERQP